VIKECEDLVLDILTGLLVNCIDFQNNRNSNFPININTASKEELELLPGIGPVLAQRIINFRDSIGLFIKVEDLILVKGIGIKKLQILEPLTIVNK